jgi:hypothetical protein
VDRTLRIAAHNGASTDLPRRRWTHLGPEVPSPLPPSRRAGGKRQPGEVGESLIRESSDQEEPESIAGYL